MKRNGWWRFAVWREIDIFTTSENEAAAAETATPTTSLASDADSSADAMSISHGKDEDLEHQEQAQKMHMNTPQILTHAVLSMRSWCQRRRRRREACNWDKPPSAQARQSDGSENEKTVLSTRSSAQRWRSIPRTAIKRATEARLCSCIGFSSVRSFCLVTGEAGSQGGVSCRFRRLWHCSQWKCHWGPPGTSEGLRGRERATRGLAATGVWRHCVSKAFGTAAAWTPIHYDDDDKSWWPSNNSEWYYQK